MLAMFGMTPRSATVSQGLATLTSGVPSGRPLTVPLRVSTRADPESRASNLGTPAKVMALPTAKLPAPTRRRVPEAMLTEPVPSGPPSRPLPPWTGVLLAPTMTPPVLTVRPPVNSFCPESWSRPLPVLVTETPVPVMIDEMLRVGRTSETAVATPGTLMASMSKTLAPEVRMTRPFATSEMM